MPKKYKEGPDLSMHIRGKITVQIQGRGVCQANLGRPKPLVAYAAQAHFLLTGQSIEVSDLRSAPWQLIEFDEQKRILVVREKEK